MNDLNRRDMLKAGVAATAAGAGLLPGIVRAAPTWSNEPEIAGRCQLRSMNFRIDT